VISTSLLIGYIIGTKSHKLRLLGMVVILTVLTGVAFFQYSTTLIASIAASSFNQRVTILAPHVSEQQEKELRTAWALMSNRTDYDAINATIAGYPALHFIRKGGVDHSLAIHPQAAERIRVYLEAAGHAHDREGPLFRPVRQSWRVESLRRHLDPDLIDRMVRKYVREIGLHRDFSAHSMRATFITRALENGASLEEVQRAAGHADATTTKLYDRRGYNPEKSASFFASY
jgi:hypothetical protein